MKYTLGLVNIKSPMYACIRNLGSMYEQILNAIDRQSIQTLLNK